MARFVRWGFSLLIVALLFGAPFAYQAWRDVQFRNFHVVREGVLYRSGQLTVAGLKRLIHDHGIRTVISLRPGDDALEKDEEEFCKREGINFYRLPPRAWWASDGTVPAEQGLRVFHEVMSNLRQHPVLVHCFAGIHRSGAYCAIYRMEYEGWDNARAIAEMKTLGYNHIDDEWDVLGYLEQYQPRHRATSIKSEPIQPASFHPDKE